MPTEYQLVFAFPRPAENQPPSTMAKLPETTVIEGEVLLREKRKWRPRYCLIRRIDSAHAMERLQMTFFNDAASARNPKKTGETHSLDEFCGLEVGQLLEAEANTLSIITTEATHSIALKNDQEMELWTKTLRRECGDEWQFDVRVMASQMKIRPGEATLRFFPAFFSLTAGSPPQCLGFWMHNQLRRYGGSKGFSFEAGSKCRGGPGMYKLETTQGSSIKELFDRVANGRRLPVPSYHNSDRQFRKSSLMEPEIAPDQSSRLAVAGDFPSSPLTQSLPLNLHRVSTCLPDRPPATLPVSSSQTTADTLPRGRSFEEVPAPKQDYVNVRAPSAEYVNCPAPSQSYAYVRVQQPRSLEDDVNYIQVDTQWAKGDRTPASSAPQSPISRSVEHYTTVDIQKTAKLNEALKTHQQDRSRPVTKHS